MLFFFFYIQSNQLKTRSENLAGQHPYVNSLVFPTSWYSNKPFILQEADRVG